MDWSDRIGRRIRLRDLHIVLAVAEEGSMAKASTKLAISHPVISKTVADLERTLGVSLFEPQFAGVELNGLRRSAVEVRNKCLRRNASGIETDRVSRRSKRPGISRLEGLRSSWPASCQRYRSPFLHRFPAVAVASRFMPIRQRCSLANCSIARSSC